MKPSADESRVAKAGSSQAETGAEPPRATVAESDQSTQKARTRKEEGARTGSSEQPQTVDGRDGLAAVGNTGLSFQLSARRVQAPSASATRDTRQTEPAVATRFSRERAQATSGRASSGDRYEARETEIQSDRPTATSQAEAARKAVQKNRVENRDASESASRRNLPGVARRLGELRAAREGEDEKPIRKTGLEEEPATTLVVSRRGGQGRTEIAQGTEQGRARDGQNVERENGQVSKPVPVELQRQKMQDSTREVGQGLQRDAEKEASQNARRTAQSADAATQTQQRVEARKSREQARDLQAERRQLQQEVRKTEQQIRQLQGKSNGPGTSAALKTANALAAGSNINLLAM